MTVKTAEMAPSLPCQITTTKRELKSFEKYKKARYLPVTEEDGCHLTLGDKVTTPTVFYLLERWWSRNEEMIYH